MTSYEELTQQSNQKSRFSALGIAALIGIGLLLIGAIMFTVPIISAGGIVSLAKESGYKPAEEVTQSFDPNTVSEISVNQVNWFGEVWLTNSEDDNLHITYFDESQPPNLGMAKYFTTAISQEGKVLKVTQEQRPNKFQPNIFIYAAHELESRPDIITIALPEGWSGKVDGLLSSSLMAGGLSISGDLHLETAGSISVIDSEIGENLVVESANSVYLNNVTAHKAVSINHSVFADMNGVTAPIVDVQALEHLDATNIESQDISLITEAGAVTGTLPHAINEYRMDIQSEFLTSERADNYGLVDINQSTIVIGDYIVSQDDIRGNAGSGRRNDLESYLPYYHYTSETGDIKLLVKAPQGDAELSFFDDQTGEKFQSLMAASKVE